jgi:lysine 2,3-aminomutase
MAGQTRGEFKELISPFLRRKLAEHQGEGEVDATLRRVIELQYVKSPLEAAIRPEEMRRHYEADMTPLHDGVQLRGVERLYRRVVVVEPTTVCAAHCRWCLRGLYPVLNLSKDELIRTARYCGDPQVNADVREVLVTGGDPLMAPDSLEVLLDALVEHAPNVRVVRLGSRVPLQAPERVNARLLEVLRSRPPVRLELGIHVNHALELFPEVEDALARLRDVGMVVYNQNVLLRGVNDSMDALVELFDAIRYLGIEAHYLFHAVPMRGQSHHRTSIARGLELIRRLTSSGRISGRSKPMFTAMTDVGKVTLYDGVIERRAGERVLLRTAYRYDDRLAWNPQWKQPASVVIDDDGSMKVWYLDGADAPSG